MTEILIKCIRFDTAKSALAELASRVGPHGSGENYDILQRAVEAAGNANKVLQPPLHPADAQLVDSFNKLERICGRKQARINELEERLQGFQAETAVSLIPEVNFGRIPLGDRGLRNIFKENIGHCEMRILEKMSL